MKKYRLLFVLIFVMFIIAPFRISAATTSVPGAEGHILEDIVTGTFAGGYDSTIIVYVTPNVSDNMKYVIKDNLGIFAVPTYDSENWHFDGWKTWYKGSHSGANVITSDKANPKYDDNENYFNVKTTGSIVEGITFPAGSMAVLKEDLWKGTYYLSAVFKPILTINTGDGLSYSISNGSKVSNNKYAVTYGGSTSINYSITDDRYMVTSVSANYGTSYSNSNEKITVNTIERPATITIHTQLKPQATYTNPTAKNLIYNGQEQELINKGTSSEGTLMYSLEENGTYSENVPKAKAAGDYTVWYYVKGDESHNDSDKQSIKVTISQIITDIGTVTAEIPDDTNDISKVVLKRTNTTIAGNLKVKEGQQLVFGNNEIEYIFTPEDDLYKIVEGKVTVTVTDTIAPVINGVEDGKTYHTSQTITVIDTNLEKVTLNGEETTDTIVISEEGNYLIVATDKAGNSSTIAIKIEPLKETYKVVFDANGGNFDDKDTYVIEDITNFDYTKFIKPTRNGYEFIGFFTEKASGKSFEEVMNSEAGIEEDMTFYARWKQTSSSGAGTAEPEENPKTFDGIGTSMFMGIISLTGLVGSIIYIRKKNKVRAN